MKTPSLRSPEQEMCPFVTRQDALHDTQNKCCKKCRKVSSSVAKRNAFYQRSREGAVRERGVALILGPATTQNLVVKFDGEICGGVLVENASDDFPQQKKLENLLPNFAGSSPPISPKTSPTSLWKSLVLIICLKLRAKFTQKCWCFVSYIARRVHKIVANVS